MGTYEATLRAQKVLSGMNADWGHAVGLGHFLKDTTALRAF